MKRLRMPIGNISNRCDAKLPGRESYLKETMRIAITGAGGFLARHLIKVLQDQGHSILEADLQSGCNILNMDDLSGLPPFDVLIHLAARTFIPDSFKDSLGFYTTNVMGTANCLEACKQRRARMVFASTYVYGTPQYLPIDEKHPVAKWNPYSTSKILAEELCEAYTLHFNVPVRVLRLFNLYGFGHAGHFLIPKIIEGIKAGEVKLFTPTPKRDFVYVKDVVDAFDRCVQKPWTGFECYNVGTGRSYSVAETVALVQKAMGTSVPVQYEGRDRAGDIMDIRADIGHIQKTLGWTPAFDLADGLYDYLSHFGDVHA